MRALALKSAKKGALRGGWAPFDVLASAPMRVEIAAWKPAEDGRGRILRLVETRGARGDVQVFWNIDARRVTAVDLLERRIASDLPQPELSHSPGAATLLRLRPFEIATLRVE
jgi:alpha-mannosidase